MKTVRLYVTSWGVACLMTLSVPAGLWAACNVVSRAIQPFRGYRGAADRAFAGPGDFVELSATECGGQAFALPATKYVVSVAFVPPGDGPATLVVQTPGDCDEVPETACGAAGVVRCRKAATTVTIGPGGIPTPVDFDKPPQRETNLRFRFPDTDAYFDAPDDGRGLTGPVAIAVTEIGKPIPCGLLQGSCATQPATVACIGEFYAEGTCADLPNASFAAFTALPVSNDYANLCTAPRFPGPCRGQVASVRTTVDAAGNLLIPMDWSGVLVRQSGEIPIARLLNASATVPAFDNFDRPLRVPSLQFLESLSPEGARLAPLFEQQANTMSTDLALFGSADAPRTVLRISRRSTVGRCEAASDRQCTTDRDCAGGDRCLRYLACDGGSNDGLPCSGEPGPSCPGGTCGPTRCTSCSDGDRAGLACVTPSDCTMSGGAFAACAPIGTSCSTDAECPATSQCGPSLFDFSSRLDESVGPVTIAGVIATALDPVPLNGIVQGDSVNAFVKEEAIQGASLNDDADQTDAVVTLQNRATGDIVAIGRNGAPGRAVTRVRDGRFAALAIASENDIVAFIEPEPLEGALDANANASVFDTLLRVFRVDGTQLGTSGNGVPADPSPVVQGRSVFVKNHRVFFRTAEGALGHMQTDKLTPNTMIRVPDPVPDRDGAKDPTISRNGRIVAFASNAAHLIPGVDTGFQEIYRLDRLDPVASIRRVSAPHLGASGNGSSRDPRMSADGRWVAFTSDAGLVPFDTNNASDAYLYDVMTDALELVSIGFGAVGGNGPSGSPSVSDDGRFVSFSSCATNLLPSSVSQCHVYVHDRTDPIGVHRLVSVNDDGVPGNGFSGFGPPISADGRYVAFQSQASNLVGDDTNGFRDIFVRDLVLGRTERVSVANDGSQATQPSFSVSLTPDGRYVAFVSYANNLVAGDTNMASNDQGIYPALDCFVRDRVRGVTERISVASDGLQGDAGSADPTFSADGRFVTFESVATTLGLGDTNGLVDAFVHDRFTGLTSRINLSSDGLQNTFVDDFLSGPVISGNSQVAAFTSRGDYHVGQQEADNFLDVFARAPVLGVGMADPSGDGDLSDTVLQVIHTAPSVTVETLGPASRVVVAGDHAAFLRPELDGAPGFPDGVDLDNDGDVIDEVVQRWTAGGSVDNLEKPAVALAMTEQYIAALVPEPAQVPLLQVHPVVGGGWEPTTVRGEVVDVFGSIAVASMATAQDPVLSTVQAWGIAEHAELISPPPLSREFVVGGRSGSELIALRTPAGNIDLLTVFDRAAGSLLSTNMSVRPCTFEACDPRFPYRVGRDTVTFLTSERDQGIDLNGDDDAVDLVLQVLNVRQLASSTGTLRRTAQSAVDVGTAAYVLGSTPLGVCTNTGEPCVDDDDDCGDGRCFVPPGGCIMDLNVTCRTDPDLANPCGGGACTCAQGQFCVPVLGQPGVGHCSVQLSPACASEADCRDVANGGDPDATCNTRDQEFQQLVAPLRESDSDQSGAKVFPSTGRCMEKTATPCDPNPVALAVDPCPAGTLCATTGGLHEGTCQRELGVCRTSDDCPTGVMCEDSLLTATVGDLDDDEVPDAFDNCPRLANVDQSDVADGDGVGDACDVSPVCIQATTIPSVRCRVIALTDRVRGEVTDGKLGTAIRSGLEQAARSLADANLPGKAGRRALAKGIRRIASAAKKLRSKRARIVIPQATRISLEADMAPLATDAAALK